MTEREVSITKLKKAKATLARLQVELKSVKLRGEQHHIKAAINDIDWAIERLDMAVRPTTVG